MQALVFDGTPALRDIPVPQPAAGEALIRVEYSAICNTDLEILRGYMGFRGVCGHEFTGIVEQGSAALRGRRVVGEINCACGDCACCRRGLPTHCPTRTVLGIVGRQGAFAEYLTLPERNLHVIPDHLSSRTALFTEPLAAALQIREQLALTPDDRILLFGTGKLGLLVAMVLQQAGLHYRAFNRNPDKVAFARSLGLPGEALTALAADEQADVCIDCTGDPEGIALALRHLRPRGTLVLKTTVAQPQVFDTNRIVINELTVIGSRCGPFAPALQLLADGSIDPEPLISAEYPLAQIAAALAAARAHDALKIIIRHA